MTMHAGADAARRLVPVQATLLQDPGAHKQLGAALPAGLLVASNTTALAVMASGGGMLHANASVEGLSGGERIEKQGAGMLLACALHLHPLPRFQIVAHAVHSLLMPSLRDPG